MYVSVRARVRVCVCLCLYLSVCVCARGRAGACGLMGGAYVGKGSHAFLITACLGFLLACTHTHLDGDAEKVLGEAKKAGKHGGKGEIRAELLVADPIQLHLLPLAPVGNIVVKKCARVSGCRCVVCVCARERDVWSSIGVRDHLHGL